MNKNSFVVGAILGALAVLLVLLLTSGWGGYTGGYGMMGSSWGMMAPWMIILAAFFCALVIWVAQNQGKKK